MMENFRSFSVVAVVASLVGGSAMGQNVSDSGVGTAAVGHWLHDQNGQAIGSVRSLSSDGRTANVMIGSYFQQGSHEAQVPVSALSIVDGKVIIQRTTMQALNGLVR